MISCQPLGLWTACVDDLALEVAEIQSFYMVVITPQVQLTTR